MRYKKQLDLPAVIRAIVVPAGYPEAMFRWPRSSSVLCTLIPWASLALVPSGAMAQSPTEQWSFAVSGDSRNCGDFVMPSIATKVKAENDAFYWHLGDFRWIVLADQDAEALQPPAPTTLILNTNGAPGTTSSLTRSLLSVLFPCSWFAAITRTSTP